MKTLTTLLISLTMLLSTSCVYQKDFQYKEVLGDWIDDFDNDDINGLFGTWFVTEIAKVGGTLKSEEEIQNQIGKRLIINQDEMAFDLWDTRKFIKPKYEVLIKDSTDAPSLKGSSFFHGYRTCREKVFYLIANGQDSQTVYFEIIHFKEMAVYYDGRLFFLTKE